MQKIFFENKQFCIFWFVCFSTQSDIRKMVCFIFGTYMTELVVVVAVVAVLLVDDDDDDDDTLVFSSI
jgi:hypothetical protein